MNEEKLVKGIFGIFGTIWLVYVLFIFAVLSCLGWLGYTIVFHPEVVAQWVKTITGG
jgi:hypothetical protein